MKRKITKNPTFSEKLIAARKAKGLTQIQLAERINSTQRAISSYENRLTYPPAPVLLKIAHVLDVTAEDLMGATKSKNKKASPQINPKTQKAWKKFQQILSLPEKDQRAIIRMINSLVAANK